MVAGKRVREWVVSEDEVLKTLRETWKLPKLDKLDAQGGIKHVGVCKETLKSIAELEKTVVQQLSNVRQKRFKELWAFKPGRPTLAPETDPKPAINPVPEWFDGAGDGTPPDEVDDVNPTNARIDGETAETETKTPAFDWL
jgi:hypothetical protein